MLGVAWAVIRPKASFQQLLKVLRGWPLRLSALLLALTSPFPPSQLILLLSGLREALPSPSLSHAGLRDRHSRCWV